MKIEDFKSVPNSTLKAVFSVVVSKWGDFIIRDCKLFDSGKNRWIQFPAREYEHEGKKKFWPNNAFKSREREDQFKEKIKQAVDEYIATTGTTIPPKISEEEIPF